MAREVIVKRVVNEVINMYFNNVIEDNGLESFEGWCENGDIFSEMDKDEENECIAYMKEIAPIVDELTETMRSC